MIIRFYSLKFISMNSQTLMALGCSRSLGSCITDKISVNWTDIFHIVIAPSIFSCENVGMSFNKLYM